MDATEIHTMSTEFFAERQTTRFWCPQCHRCLEDGPNGLRLIRKGDQEARHVGGLFASSMHIGIEPAAPEARILH